MNSVSPHGIQNKTLLISPIFLTLHLRTEEVQLVNAALIEGLRRWPAESHHEDYDTAQYYGRTDNPNILFTPAYTSVETLGGHRYPVQETPEEIVALVEAALKGRVQG